MTINPFRAEMFTIRIGFPGKQYKICKLMFDKDGSVYIAFPYFKNSKGLVSVCTHYSGKTTVNLGDGGKVTSHLVKFAHHESGITHFSQAGKVNTNVRKKAEPLESANGHFATIQLQGLSGFIYNEHESTDGKISNKDQILTVRDEDANDQKAYKLLFHHYTFANLMPNLRGAVVGPIVAMHQENGDSQPTWMLSPPLSYEHHARVVLLSCKEIPLMSHEPDPFITFIGGFDPKEIRGDQPAQFLSLMYPCSDFEGLKATIGCIDQEIHDASISF